MWRARTRRDEPGMEDNPPTQCACGRTTQADMLVDVRMVAADTRKAWGLRVGADYACDACREFAFATGRCTREDFARAIGAPESTLSRIRAASAPTATAPLPAPRE